MKTLVYLQRRTISCIPNIVKNTESVLFTLQRKMAIIWLE